MRPPEQAVEDAAAPPVHIHSADHAARYPWTCDGCEEILSAELARVVVEQRQDREEEEREERERANAPLVARLVEYARRPVPAPSCWECDEYLTDAEIERGVNVCDPCAARVPMVRE
jgi:hypothetical protein